MSTQSTSAPWLLAALGFGGGLAGAALVYFLIGPAVTTSVNDGLADRLEALAARVSAVEAVEPRLAKAESALRQQADDLESANFEARINAVASLAANVEEALGKLETAFEEAGTSDLIPQVEKLTGDLSLLSQSVSALQAAQLPADLPARLDSVAGDLADARTVLGAAQVQVSDFGARLTALEEKVATPDPVAEAALGVALANLTRAFERGEPFGRELDAVAALSLGGEPVEALRAASQTGLTSFALLKQNFSELVPQIFTAEKQAGREGFWAKLMGNAASIVTVRRTGDMEGDTSEAIVARIEQRLLEDDLPGAAAEAATLTGPGAEVIAPWLAKAEARVTADQLIRELSARVLETLPANRG